MVSPEYLNPYNTGTYALAFKFREILQVGGVDHYVYDNQSNSSNINYSIAVNAVTNTWVDYGTDHPFDPVVEETQPNGDVTIRLSSVGYPNLFTFLKPTVASWIPEEPATGTEGSGSCQLIYNAATNVMHYFMNATEPSTDMISTRNLHYRVRNASINNVSTDVNFNHYSGTHTHGDFNPTFAGTYQLEKVLTNPLEVLICDSASVTQSYIDAFNASNTPPNTPRGRRGNLNFW